jgi:hypothetical protein
MIHRVRDDGRSKFMSTHTPRTLSRQKFTTLHKKRNKKYKIKSRRKHRIKEKQNGRKHEIKTKQ